MTHKLELYLSPAVYTKLQNFIISLIIGAVFSFGTIAGISGLADLRFEDMNRVQLISEFLLIASFVTWHFMGKFEKQ